MNVSRIAFNGIDTDAYGTVDKAEIRKVLEKSGYTRTEADEFIRRVDKNKDGKINLEEFISYFINACGRSRKFDKNKIFSKFIDRMANSSILKTN
jgi:hypothetical protein